MWRAGNNLKILALFILVNLVIIPTKLLIMKKILLVGIVLIGVIALSSCNYDDSNDIDIITPNDSTQTGIGINQKTL